MKASNNITEKLKNISDSSGVYLMKDKKGIIIYIGKALNLKKRLYSYFNNSTKQEIKTKLLINKTSDFEVIITKTEQEALILESNLIKRHQPKYNVILKDDKRYPCLKLNIKDKWPRLAIARKIEKDGAIYFGPFASGSAVKRTLKFIDKNFKLRKCRSKKIEIRKRACLNFQMNICFAPCQNRISVVEYHNIIKETILFLKGKTPELIKKITSDMQKAAQLKKYEKAVKLRDKKFAIEKTLEKQLISNTDLIDRDVIGIAGNHQLYIINILYIRAGRLVGTKHFEFNNTIYQKQEILSSFIRQYYEKEPFIPKQILIPANIKDKKSNEQLLFKFKQKKVKILCYKKGDKAGLIKTAVTNAENILQQKLASNKNITNNLIKLKEILKINNIPNRIECFDNSNTSGTNPVSAMVVFINGKQEKKAYRKYKIKTKENNDCAYMAEVLKRRFLPQKNKKTLPDLLILDGGKGQLNTAISVLEQLGIKNKFQVIGIAKKDEAKGEIEDKIYKHLKANPVNFGANKQTLSFLQQIRDEAHRFTVSFHRNLRKRKTITSQLDNIYGIGKKRKALLLKHYKSVKKIKNADTQDIQKVLKINQEAASRIKTALSDRVIK
ncbi:MAG: excinuclease ABC subunit UvrC [Deltaproteobacteria bacterium]|nr:excinuclease ABC subunit UvrC [Deltaproteobacteria bacterium]